MRNVRNCCDGRRCGAQHHHACIHGVGITSQIVNSQRSPPTTYFYGGDPVHVSPTLRRPRHAAARPIHRLLSGHPHQPAPTVRPDRPQPIRISMAFPRAAGTLLVLQLLPRACLLARAPSRRSTCRRAWLAPTNTKLCRLRLARFRATSSSSGNSFSSSSRTFSSSSRTMQLPPPTRRRHFHHRRRHHHHRHRHCPYQPQNLFCSTYRPALTTSSGQKSTHRISSWIHRRHRRCPHHRRSHHHHHRCHNHRCRHHRSCSGVPYLTNRA